MLCSTSWTTCGQTFSRTPLTWSWLSAEWTTVRLVRVLVDETVAWCHLLNVCKSWGDYRINMSAILAQDLSSSEGLFFHCSNPGLIMQVMHVSWERPSSMPLMAFGCPWGQQKCCNTSCKAGWTTLSFWSHPASQMAWLSLLCPLLVVAEWDVGMQACGTLPDECVLTT